MPKPVPIHPNVGIRTAYQRKLECLMDEMAGSVLYWTKAAYRANTPEITQDVSPAVALRAAMKRLSRRWLKRFDKGAVELARYFATEVSKRTDGALRASLTNAGFAVKFKLTPAQNDIVQAVVAENVSLIRSIATQYLTQVEGAVMRSVQVGRDLHSLTNELVEHAGVARRKAARIALSQNNLATAALARARQLELGITKAKWLHSAGGKVPRHEHVEFSGKEYDVAKGHDFQNGEGIVWPGTAINCRCVSIPVIPGF